MNIAGKGERGGRRMQNVAIQIEQKNVQNINDEQIC